MIYNCDTQFRAKYKKFKRRKIFLDNIKTILEKNIDFILHILIQLFFLI